MQNGKVRYYEELKPPNEPGTVAGRGMVRECDPATGQKRTWHETLDHRGRVRQIRPVGSPGEPKKHYLFDENGKLEKVW